MKLKPRKFLILLMFPIHLMLLFRMKEMQSGTALLLAVLLILAADFVLSFIQTETFSARDRNIPGFAVRFLPYLLQKILIAAADGITAYFWQESDFIKVLSTDDLWFAVCAAGLLLSALVVLVTGWARTMLYHDEP